MMLKTTKKIVAIIFLIGVLSACANDNKDNHSKNRNQLNSQGKLIVPITTTLQEASKIMYDYQLYQLAIDSLKLKQTEAAYNFLATQVGQRNSMVEKTRLGLLRVLGENAREGEFLSQYALLDKNIDNLEVNCYAAAAGYSQNGISLISMSKKLVRSNEKLPEGCNKMLEIAASKGMLNEADVWKRVRILISHNNLTLAKSLANAIGAPINGSQSTLKASKIIKIMPGITLEGRKRSDIDGFIYGLYGNVDQDDIGFLEGIVGLFKAKNLNMDSALQHFSRADKNQLSNEQWEWYARSALRVKRWHQLNQIIGYMPVELRNTPTWWYWQARAKVATGDKQGANDLYEKVAASGRNFYAILAHEELARPLSVKSNTSVGNSVAMNSLARDSQIHRALVLFRNSLGGGDQKMRTAAQEQWKFAIRNFTDEQLILASQLALQNQFYEMSIYSADISDSLLNYQLRFPAPYKNIVDKYTGIYGVESAWVFGLIRQESRFMTVARSKVGASGLMQIMAGTAKMIARKIGLEHYNLNDMDNNINMGVWYLSDLYNEFYSEPLATSAYNAGPGRARKWRQSGLEGAIYTETIPFNETRDYVKKVMSNTVYYSHLFGLPKRSLKYRLGSM